MQKTSIVKNLVVGTLLSMALTSCGGGSGSGSGGGSTYGAYNSANISVDQFVNALNNVDGAPVYDESEVELYTDETYRSAVPGEENWFVIYDAKFTEYKAISLEYVRSIIYYDYYSNNYATADEFRDIEADDILGGEVDGDTWGDDYEVVDYDAFSDSFWGRNSGFEYEDEDESTDTVLLAAEKEKMQFFQQASNLSYAFKVGMDTAMSLVSLGEKIKSIQAKSGGELTKEDELALSSDIEKITGVNLDEMMEATKDSVKKQEVLDAVADKIGTTAQNLEDSILPDLLGVQL